MTGMVRAVDFLWKWRLAVPTGIIRSKGIPVTEPNWLTGYGPNMSTNWAHSVGTTGGSEIVVSNRVQIWTNLSLASGICWLIRLLHLSLVAQVKKRTNPHLNWTCKIRTKHKFLAKLDMFELELPPKQYRHLALQVWVGGLIYEHVQTKAVQN